MSEDTRRDSIRAFVAFDPAVDVRARLLALRDALAASGADVRWIRDDNAHCTLKFLGGVPAARIDDVAAVLRASVASVRPFEMRARGAGAFPSAARPRVVWAGLEGEGAGALAATIDAALAPLGFAREERPFRPHVTLGRVRSPRGAAALAAALAAHASDDLGALTVARILLYASRPQAGGPVYTPLHTIPLG